MALISSPTSLTTFSQPHASSSKNPHVRLNPVVGDKKSAVVAVQGDGVWTYDLTTLRATTSFTVPPSTVFTSSPVSFWTTKTVSAPQANDQGGEDEGMDVDQYEGLDGPKETQIEIKERVTAVGAGKEVWLWKGEEGEKEVIRIKSQISAIHHLPSPATPLLLISSSSQFYLLDSKLQSHSISTASLKSSELLASRVILQETKQSVRVIVVDRTGRIEVTKIWIEDRRLERILEGKVGNGKLVAGDVSDDGVITVLDEQHNLYTTSARTLSTPSSPVRLLHPSSAPLLLSLPSPTLPLVLLPTPHPSPSLLLAIPASNLPTILTTTPLSSFTSSGTISALSILSVRSGVYTIGVVLSHKHSEGEGSSGRSVLYTCEVALPERGVGMGSLLGSKARTGEYLEVEGTEKKQGKTELEKKQDKVLEGLEKALKSKDVTGAQKTWRDWVAKESDTAEGVFSDRFVRKVVRAVFGAALNEDSKPKGVYAGEILKDLVSRRVVSDGMWKEGVVVDGLLPLGDWENITLALQNIPTIPSSTIIILLQKSAQSSNASSVPSLTALLQIILALPPPGPSYRLDLYKTLSVEDAAAMLKVLVQWMEDYVETLSEGLKGWDESVSQEKEDNLPSLQSLVTHTSLILDAHLPSFISHSASHDILSRAQASLEPLLAVQNEYRQLRGPVEALLTLARREAKKAEERAAKKGGKKKGKKDENGRLPEEVVGKWKVEDLAF
ncbi:hypothetical protein CNB04100 [Cryptococcus deneoformans JEC21]|uniref:Uncharacterized protein n=1 Tax=Cryptococcus deneoformans (strain JEC21 / ATCC MYA-565) TaxID=214684 RepID=Q5KLT8_CRYD1|nr:hypothetical protein CNB04100 [Cryptococcus neoformans var. neoformans JEC21]AAW41928.1 hypothetical protein CNB04100 [Cryptococcus neoformans var. neoformans JEC21]